ncbi:dihydroxyacetone kinase subunit DhaL [[Acholeplasma] multilocale]|uniref:dihydroxyacetone kinase subunit DhaL n=1 Tax=[Acholeplasma] multilocale TaxID=264638 RepID=UPI0003FA791D|nr:dihydroxyacetone kinase subunit DhaL [[Acholeplasma] multilocale]
MKLDAIFKNIYQTLLENKQHLNDLDQAIGDGDHGTNIVRGFEGVVNELDTYGGKNTDTILRSVAMTLMSKIGGSSGPLLGSMLLQMSGVWKNDDLQTAVKSFEAGLNGIIRMGEAELEDKTMIDALAPAVQTMKNNLDKAAKEVFELAAIAAKTGAENTINLIAKKGRASYLGQRSVGHMDPGAYSMYLVLDAIGRTL